jgi:hypothetical protein
MNLQIVRGARRQSEQEQQNPDWDGWKISLFDLNQRGVESLLCRIKDYSRNSLF